MQVVRLAAICWAIWKLRNRACFEHKLIRSELRVCAMLVPFLKYWTGLHRGGQEDMLSLGAAILQDEAMLHHPAQTKVDVPRITYKASSDEKEI